MPMLSIRYDRCTDLSRAMCSWLLLGQDDMRKFQQPPDSGTYLQTKLQVFGVSLMSDDRAQANRTLVRIIECSTNGNRQGLPALRIFVASHV